jgi:integrase
MDISALPTNTADYIKDRINGQVVQTICGGKSTRRKWLSFFLEHIMKYTIPLNDSWFNFTDVKLNENPIERNDGSDQHRIPASALEKMYLATESSILDRLIFMLLLTTGIRVGALVKIKTEHVAHISGTDVAILETGRSIEKGNKWFSFILATPVRELMFKWITIHRLAVDSLYLFPGRYGHISTANVRYRFKNIAKKAGIDGKFIHTHAMRHTYAHMMLEFGNSVEVVAKLLGHSDSKTTEQYYLKENAIEVANRANIPWLEKNNAPKQVVPDFLKRRESREATSETKESKKRQKKRKIMASISMFSDLQNLQQKSIDV